MFYRIYLIKKIPHSGGIFFMSRTLIPSSSVYSIKGGEIKVLIAQQII